MKWQEIRAAHCLIRKIRQTDPAALGGDFALWAVHTTEIESKASQTGVSPSDEDAHYAGVWLNHICKAEGLPTFYAPGGN